MHRVAVCAVVQALSHVFSFSLDDHPGLRRTPRKKRGMGLDMASLPGKSEIIVSTFSGGKEESSFCSFSSVGVGHRVLQ